MKANAENLLSLLKGPRQFVIPIYQRTYCWTIAQCQQLLQDILKISQNDSVNGHFIGSVVHFQPSITTICDVPELLIIDGQQRLTTVSLLVLALAEFLEKTPNVEIDTTPTKLKNYYLINNEESGEKRFKLLLTQGDKTAFCCLVDGTPLPEHVSGKIVKNYNFFQGKITRENIKDIYDGMMRLFVVDVALEKDKDDPQLIFESMNSTGLALSQTDLIRNYVLMRLPFDQQTRLYEKYWFPIEQSYGNEYELLFNSFMRDYLTFKQKKIPRKDGVYEAFKNFVNTREQGIEEIVADIFEFSSYYSKMMLHKEIDQDLNEAFVRLSQLKVDVCYPFLLPVYRDYMHQTISADDFLSIICRVESYVFRRAVCGIPTNSLNKTFMLLYHQINREKYLESLDAALISAGNYKRFPTDREFMDSLLSKDIYTFPRRNYLLTMLENEGRKERISIGDYTVEHIMPQSANLSSEWQSMLGEQWQEIHKKYIHHLGNLTLTGYNSELSNRSFSEKKKIPGGFNDSPLRLNEYPRQTDKWGVEQIETRAQLLARKACQIWTCPVLTQEILDSYKKKPTPKPSVYSMETYDWTPDMLELFHVVRKRILNLDPSVREIFLKRYIAYKIQRNFVDIIPQKHSLRISLNIPFNEVTDPERICRNIKGLGRWGNGETEVVMKDSSRLEAVMKLTQYACERQINGCS
ncbi:DUF262 and DUF1524 domain-containing protein [uncultured Akkermansia sp.]|jgi:uncharacterized protein with ParB-like and HNH nuclease domain/predicted transport protein|uniref:DUF262 and DUF1524 domain-containing protein n=1 Tax=uncultured Akkermansia sp. TaxID=512294 RepID=UPI0025F0B4FD|nr:DUF262 and DUF1524 domain-containing protein [uncultured Akkermansia sp.]